MPSLELSPIFLILLVTVLSIIIGTLQYILRFSKFQIHQDELHKQIIDIIKAIN